MYPLGTFSSSTLRATDRDLARQRRAGSCIRPAVPACRKAGELSISNPPIDGYNAAVGNDDGIVEIVDLEPALLTLQLFLEFGSKQAELGGSIGQLSHDGTEVLQRLH